MSLRNLMRLAGALLSLALVGTAACGAEDSAPEALGTAHAALVPPSGTYTHFFWPNVDLRDFQWTLTPEIDPSPAPYFWSHQFGFQGGDAGYAGLQTVGARLHDKVAIFSIWQALAASTTTPGGICAPFSGEGEGYSCLIPYAWQAGKTYGFELESVGASSWQVAVTNIETNTTTPIGTIRVPSAWVRLSTWSSMWTEFYGPQAETCSGYPYSRVLFGLPRANDGTVGPATIEPFINQTQPCRDRSKVTLAGGGARQEMHIPRCGESGVTCPANRVCQSGVCTPPGTNLTEPRCNFHYSGTSVIQACVTLQRSSSGQAHALAEMFGSAGSRLQIDTVTLRDLDSTVTKTAGPKNAAGAPSLLLATSWGGPFGCNHDLTGDIEYSYRFSNGGTLFRGRAATSYRTCSR